MTILTLLRTELRRLTSTRLGVLAFVALMAVPLLYGGVYLWGNLDPYGRFSSVPAGVVVADAGTTDGATSSTGTTTTADTPVATLGKTFDALLATTGQSATGSDSLQSFLQTLASRLHGAPATGAVVSTTA